MTNTTNRTGDLAGKVALVTGTDGFFELKRSRDRKPSFE